MYRMYFFPLTSYQLKLTCDLIRSTLSPYVRPRSVFYRTLIKYEVESFSDLFCSSLRDLHVNSVMLLLEIYFWSDNWRRLWNELFWGDFRSTADWSSRSSFNFACVWRFQGKRILEGVSIWRQVIKIWL